MQRAIVLQTDATKHKNAILKEFSINAVSLANLMLKRRKSKRLMDLHREMYLVAKKTTPFGSQVICDIERSVVRTKGGRLKTITVKFNTPRNCKTFHTKSRLFVKLTPYSRKPIAVPIRKNRNYQRYCDLVTVGWRCKTYGLTTDGQIVAYLSKEQTIPERHNVLGVDVNSKCFTASVLTPDGKVLKQVYYGKDIWTKRRRIFKRRELLKPRRQRKPLRKTTTPQTRNQ